MKIYFLDTNILARGFLKDNKKSYSQIKKLFDEAKQGLIKLVIIPEVFIELDFLLTKIYHIPKPIIIDFIYETIATPYIDIRDRILIIDALFLYRDKDISLMDCWVYTSAKSEDASVFSFDKDFRKLLS